MRLSDVVSSMGAAWMQEAALLIFFVVFVAIVVHAWLRPQAEIERMARIPVDDDASDIRRRAEIKAAKFVAPDDPGRLNGCHRDQARTDQGAPR